MYRAAPVTRLVVFGGLALLVLACIAASLSLSQSSGARYAWSGCGVVAVLFAILIKRRLVFRASEHIQIDDNAIALHGPGGFRLLPWAGVAYLSVRRGGALELSDASRTNAITLGRHFEPFPVLVADVVRHLDAAYATRSGAARHRQPSGVVSFASSVLPEVTQVLGSVAWTALFAWLSPLESAAGAVRGPTVLSWLDPLAFVFGLAWLPLTLWRLARVAYGVDVGPGGVAITTLAGTREIPAAGIAAVRLVSDRRGRPAIVIADTSGELTGLRLTDRPLELYDLLRGLHERLAAAAPAAVMPMRLVPARAAAFIAACTVVFLAVASIPIFDGGVLRFAASHGYTRVAAAVLRLGSPVDFRGTTQMTPLCLASRDGNLPIVTLLLARGANPSGPCRDGEFTPLHVASQNGHFAIVHALLDGGASPDERNRSGRTSLSNVAWQNRASSVDMATLLVDRGASLDLADNDGVAPIYWAVWGKNLPMIRYLTAHGVNVNVRGPKGQPLLIRATYDGNLEVLALLLDAGARFDLVGNDGFNALQTATWNGQRDVVTMMLARGADINAVTEIGTALYAAVTHHQPDLVALLLDHGARWDLGYHDLTALQRAARGGELVMVRMMLDRGADPNLSTTKQPQSLILASDQGHLDVVRLLVDRGADVSVQWKEWTPLKAAQVHQHPAVVEYLRAHGAR
jgi:ankyrin repeat protein